jgi:hypothetical protein
VTIQHLFATVPLPTALAFIVGYFAAHAAGLLTAAHAPKWVLGAVTTVLATLAAVIPTVAIHPGDNWKVYLGNVATALVATTLGHKSQIPSALHRGTPGVHLPRRPRDAGYGLIEVCFALVLLVIALVILFHYVH